MVDESIIKTVKIYLRAVQEQGFPVNAGIVFGSYVTGKAHNWSDIDLVVISPKFDTNRQRSDIDLPWYLAAITDSRIEPIAVGEQQYAQSRDSVIIEIARREGQIIPLAD